MRHRTSCRSPPTLSTTRRERHMARRISSRVGSGKAPSGRGYCCILRHWKTPLGCGWAAGAARGNAGSLLASAGMPKVEAGAAAGSGCSASSLGTDALRARSRRARTAALGGGEKAVGASRTDTDRRARGGLAGSAEGRYERW